MRAADRKRAQNTDKYGWVRIGTEIALLGTGANAMGEILQTPVCRFRPRFSVIIRTYPYPSVSARRVRGRRLACAPAGTPPQAAVSVCQRRLAETQKRSLNGICPHTLVARRSPPSAQGASEAILFADQKGCRVHPSIAAASEAFAATLRRTLNAGRRYLKKAPMRYIFLADAEKEARGKAQGCFPAGRGATAPCIKTSELVADAIELAKRRQPPSPHKS